MRQIAPGIYIEDAFAGVTLGALILPHGTIMVDAPLRAEDARTWRASITNLSIVSTTSDGGHTRGAEVARKDRGRGGRKRRNGQ